MLGSAGHENDVLPHDLDAERAVLGAVIVDDTRFQPLADALESQAFYRHAHRVTFDRMADMNARGVPIDERTLNSELKRFGELEEVGGPAYIGALTTGVPRGSNVNAYAKTIVDTARARRIISELAAAASHAANGRIGTAIELAAEVSRCHEVQDVYVERVQTLRAFFDEHAEGQTAKPLIAGLIPGSGVVMLHSQPRGRKTLTAIECCIAIATGTKAFGLLETDTCGVPSWYLSDEDPALEARDRFAGNLMARGMDFTDPPDNLLVSIQQGINLDDPETQAWVIATIRAKGIRSLWIDPVRAHTMCADAGPKEFKPFGDFLRRVDRETKAVTCLIHHDVKPSVDGRPDSRRRAQRASGGAIFSAAQAPISVERLDATRTMLVPDSFKFGADPTPIELTFDFSAGIRISGRYIEGEQADDISVDALVLHYLHSHSGAKSGDIPPALKKSRPDVFAALERLEGKGQARHRVVGKAKHWQAV